MLEYILGDMMDSLKIKIVFFDIDGTLTNSNKVMSENTINTLNKLIEKNIFIVLCSGRANSYIKQYLKLINKSKYSISNNGALIYDNDLNKIIISHTLYSKDLEYLWNYSNETKSGFFKARDTVDGAIPSSFAISVILTITINTHYIQK